MIECSICGERRSDRLDVSSCEGRRCGFAIGAFRTVAPSAAPWAWMRSSRGCFISVLIIGVLTILVLNPFGGSR